MKDFIVVHDSDGFPIAIRVLCILNVFEVEDHSIILLDHQLPVYEELPDRHHIDCIESLSEIMSLIKAATN